MFRKTAELYDAIYSFKDYAAESARLTVLLKKRHPEAKTLLDVACGTGAHLEHLSRELRVEGLDLDPGLLDVARRRLPGVPLHLADMVDFDLGRCFDAVVCLFSSIGYVRTIDNLRHAAARMAAHTNGGGLVIIEPWLFPDTFTSGHIGVVTVDRSDVKIARMNSTEARGRLSILHFHYLVGRDGMVEHLTEDHEAGLFTVEEYTGALKGAGLEVEFDPEGLMGRGLFIGRKAA